MKHLEIASELGIKPEEFWAMIPSEFVIYAKGRFKFISEEEERHQWKVARLSAVIANFAPRFSKGDRKKWQPKDFMPKKKQTQDDMIKEVERLNKLFGGKDKRRKE